jgi:hypothetical protein
VGEEHSRQTDRQNASRRQPHDHAASAVDEHGGLAGTDERGGTGSIRAGQRTSGSEKGYLDAHAPTVGPRLLSLTSHALPRVVLFEGALDPAIGARQLAFLDGVLGRAVGTPAADDTPAVAQRPIDNAAFYG